MRRDLAAALVTLCAVAGILSGCGDEPATESTAPARELVFDDDFDGDELDITSWSTCHWWAIERQCTITGTGEMQLYRPENVTVGGGRLQLTAQPEERTGPDDRRFEFTSGMISTGPPSSGEEPNFEFLYGDVEWVAWVPAGKGLWPALWMLPSDQESKPEIDLVEIYGDQPDLVRMRLHYLDDAGEEEVPGERFEGTGLSEGWHTFGLRWREDSLEYLVDGEVRWYYDGPGVPAEPMYLVANLAVGGDRPGAPDDDTEFPARFAIHRVRVRSQ